METAEMIEVVSRPTLPPETVTISPDNQAVPVSGRASGFRRFFLSGRSLFSFMVAVLYPVSAGR